MVSWKRIIITITGANKIERGFRERQRRLKDVFSRDFFSTGRRLLRRRFVTEKKSGKSAHAKIFFIKHQMPRSL
jgi:hypothetical protein